MSIHTDDLRNLAASTGHGVCDLAADEIEDLERAYALLFAENGKLCAQIDGAKTTDDAGILRVREGDGVSMVHPLYGSGWFFTEDCFLSTKPDGGELRERACPAEPVIDAFKPMTASEVADAFLHRSAEPVQQDTKAIPVHVLLRGLPIHKAQDIHGACDVVLVADIQGRFAATDLATPHPVQPEEAVARDATSLFLAAVEAELRRARSLFPGDRIMGLALAEEFGELIKAMLDESGANVWKEAVQTAVMAARVAIDGDSSVDDWRASKGLDDHRCGILSRQQDAGGAKG